MTVILRVLMLLNTFL